MEIIQDKLIVYKGERFNQKVSGIDFDTATQILFLLYKDNEDGFTKSFVKAETEEYQNSGIVSSLEDGSLTFVIDTEGFETGKYFIETRVDVSGVQTPIIKGKKELFTLKQSKS